LEDSDSDDEDKVLPSGGDTSVVEDPNPEPYPRRRNTLRKRLTNGFQGSGDFLIGNSLGVERHRTTAATTTSHPTLPLLPKDKPTHILVPHPARFHNASPIFQQRNLQAWIPA
jgi:rRNA maturation protein Nop10